MKKLLVKPVILLTLIASLLIVSSCEESAEVVEADLIGAWDIGDASVDVMVGPVKLLDFLISTMQFGQAAAEELVDQLIAELVDLGGGTVTFNSDYTCLMSRNELEENGTWKLEGDQLYLNISGEFGGDDPLTVQSMNSSAAVVAWEQDQEIHIDQGVNNINATLIFELNLSKQ